MFFKPLMVAWRDREVRRIQTGKNSEVEQAVRQEVASMSPTSVPATHVEKMLDGRKLKSMTLIPIPRAELQRLLEERISKERAKLDSEPPRT